MLDASPHEHTNHEGIVQLMQHGRAMRWIYKFSPQCRVLGCFERERQLLHVDDDCNVYGWLLT